MRILSSNDVKQIFSMQDAFSAAKKACTQNVLGEADIPDRIRIINAENESDSLFMPGRLPQLNTMGIKIVSGVPGNVNRELPVNIGIIILFDDLTGEPLLVMEGGSITDMRTGALTGVACKYLAKPNSSTMSIIGTGAQAWTQVLAVSEVFDLNQIRVYSRNAQRVSKFAQSLKGILPNVNIVPTSSAKEAVQNTDIVVCATTSTTPVISRNWLSPGTCVCSIGANSPQGREVDGETVKDASIIVADYRKAVLSSAGDIIIPINEGLIKNEQIIDLGELVMGKKKGRKTHEELTFFRSVGFAGVDICCAKLILDKVKKLDIGVEVPLYSK